jgi:hypothetical protein
VHRIATQQLGLTVFTVAELKRTQPPLKNLEGDAPEVPLARMSEYVPLLEKYLYVIHSVRSSSTAIPGPLTL